MLNDPPSGCHRIQLRHYIIPCVCMLRLSTGHPSCFSFVVLQVFATNPVLFKPDVFVNQLLHEFQILLLVQRIQEDRVLLMMEGINVTQWKIQLFWDVTPCRLVNNEVTCVAEERGVCRLKLLDPEDSGTHLLRTSRFTTWHGVTPQKTWIFISTLWQPQLLTVKL